MRIALNGEAFRKLVRGEEIVLISPSNPADPVHIILSDIGFEIMHHMIDEAEEEQYGRTQG
jgi:hypothetical protein